MSFYHLPHPWDPKYAIPRYVMAEPPERGTYTTQWLPRGTISEVLPDYYAKRVGSKILGRTDAQLGSLAGSSLAGSCFGGGDSLAGSTLEGSSLGLTRFELKAMGADAPTSPPVSAPAKKSGPALKTVAIGAAVVAGALYFFGKKKRGVR